MHSRKAFTLIELLVVIAIIAILAVVVVLTLNPAELLKQSRDSQRLSDMSTLNDALGIFSVNTTNANALGSIATTYVSIPDPLATSTLGDQCQGLNLPALSTGDTYQCPASSNSRNTDGTGWIPVDFNSLPTGSPVGNLPVDPTNQSSSGLFYTYTTNGTNYEVTSILESQKYKGQFGSSPQNPLFPEVLTQGTNLSLSELFNPNGLVGYWPLNEGSGSTANDLSGNQNNGTWSGTQASPNSTYYGAGNIAPYAGYFDGSTDGVSLGTSSVANTVSNNITIAAWINMTALLSPQANVIGNLYYQLLIDQSGSHIAIEWDTSNDWTGANVVFSGTWLKQWIFIATSQDSSGNKKWYVNGSLVKETSVTGELTPTSSFLCMGRTGVSSGCGGFYFPGLIDDVRIYNRALSAAEIQALYNAEK